MAKRDIILEKILEGGATKESLMEAADVNEKGLASQMTYLRLMGKCPMKQEDGTFKIVSREEWDEYRASSGSKADANLTPQERIEKAEKAVTRCVNAADRAKKAAESDPENELKSLQAQVAVLNLKIANIKQGQLEEQFRDELVAETEGVDEAESEDLA